MTLFKYRDYKRFVRDRIAARPHNGRGEYARLARALGLHTTMVSQIFRGDKHLSIEHALLLADDLGLSKFETDYFLLLVQRDRASTHQLKKYYDGLLEEQRGRSEELVNRVPRTKDLTEAERALFYSTWHYTAIHLATDINGFNDIDSIAAQLGLERKLVREVVAFLLNTGLCRQEKDKLRMGVANTHLEAHSPLISKHHMNWRMKAIERHSRLSPRELSYSGPMSLSENDFQTIREDLVQAIEKIVARVGKSPSEKLACLNIDWIEV